MPLIHYTSRSVLLNGLSGCGKTLLAKAIGGVHTQTILFFLPKTLQEFGFPFISISAPSIVSGIGASEKTLHEIFERAKVGFLFAKVTNPLNHQS